MPLERVAALAHPLCYDEESLILLDDGLQAADWLLVYVLLIVILLLILIRRLILFFLPCDSSGRRDSDTRPLSPLPPTSPIRSPARFSRLLAANSFQNIETYLWRRRRNGMSSGGAGQGEGGW